MTAADFTPVTPEAAAGFLDAALFDGAPADGRLLDAWATIVAQGEAIAELQADRTAYQRRWHAALKGQS